MMERPDEFEVMVVRSDGCTWETYGTYETRSEAMETAEGLDRGIYRMIGIKPQISALRPFQTHANQVIWEARK